MPLDPRILGMLPRTDGETPFTVWEERACYARRDIAALAAEGLGVSDLHAAAIDLIEARVGADLTCWATIDPETLVISTMTSGESRIPSEHEPRLAEAEYSVMSRIHSQVWRSAN
jgi:hypothetical protein